MATQYIKHAPDVEAPLIVGGTSQSVECAAGVAPTGDANALLLVDQCQPRTALTVTQQAGPVVNASQCRLDKVVARRTVTWSVADPCGNEARASGTVAALDTLAPVISVADYTVPCALRDQCVDTHSGGVAPEWAGYASALDRCAGPVATSYRDSVPAVPGCDLIVRTWSAVDSCGNAAAVNQTISFEAAQTPQFVVPPNVTVECAWDLGM